MSTLPFDLFWAWLRQHPNCVQRVGTPKGALYDDDDLHWHLGEDGPRMVVQLIRGKRVVGEVVVDPEEITYVESLGEEEEGEHLFEAIKETKSRRVAAYYFVVAHGMVDEEEPSPPHGAVH
jgi:hypothetical protein